MSFLNIADFALACRRRRRHLGRRASCCPQVGSGATVCGLSLLTISSMLRVLNGSRPVSRSRRTASWIRSRQPIRVSVLKRRRSMRNWRPVKPSWRIAVNCLFRAYCGGQVEFLCGAVVPCGACRPVSTVLADRIQTGRGLGRGLLTSGEVGKGLPRMPQARFSRDVLQHGHRRLRDARRGH